MMVIPLQKLFKSIKGRLGFFKGTKEGYITPEKAEEEQKEFKSEINEIVIGSKKSEDQISAISNIKTLYEHKKKLSNCLMIILELCLKLNTKQNMEKVSRS